MATELVFEMRSTGKLVKKFVMQGLAYLFMTLVCIQSWAFPPTYGAEFELTNQALGNAPEFTIERASGSPEKVAQIQFVEAITAHCKIKKCTVIEVEGKWDKDYQVIYEDKWWFKVSFDPRCVEITFKPSTLEQLSSETLRERINQDIFGVGKTAGLRPKAAESNHVNIGVTSAFGRDGKKFLRFFVDYANRPDLALGGLGYDISNAPPLSVLSEPQRLALDRLVAQVNAGELKTVQEVAFEIQTKVYTKSFNPSWGGVGHYQAIGLKKINQSDLAIQDAPMEFRAMWGQRSAEQFELIAKLLETRIEFLSKDESPIVYLKKRTKSSNQYGDKELKTRLFIYVSESGFDFEKYQQMLPDWMRQAGVENFLKPHGNPLKRLESLEKYADLMLISPYMQKLAIEAINNRAVLETPARNELMSKIQQGLSQYENVPEAQQLFHEFEKHIELDLYRKSKVNFYLRCNLIH